jgi:hypothetical protein
MSGEVGRNTTENKKTGNKPCIIISSYLRAQSPLDFIGVCTYVTIGILWLD